MLTDACRGASGLPADLAGVHRQHCGGLLWRAAAAVAIHHGARLNQPGQHSITNRVGASGRSLPGQAPEDVCSSSCGVHAAVIITRCQCAAYNQRAFWKHCHNAQQHNPLGVTSNWWHQFDLEQAAPARFQGQPGRLGWGVFAAKLGSCQRGRPRLSDPTCRDMISRQVLHAELHSKAECRASPSRSSIS